MTSELIRLGATLVIAFLTVRTTCKVLHMRSNAVYAALYLGNVIMNLALANDSALDGFRTIVLNFLTGFVMPIWYSTGPLKSRVLRVGLIEVCLVFVEVVCATTYLLLTGANVRVSDFSAVSPFNITVVYIMGISVLLLASEIVIAACRKSDQEDETPFVPSLINFNLATYFLYVAAFDQMKWRTIDDQAIPVAIIFLACMVMSFLVSNFVYSIANREAQASRTRANHAASTRQMRHSKVEVASSMKRVLGVRRLYHDLANQVDIVDELVRSGNGREADQYLAQLQAQAQDLVGDFHE